MKKFDYLKIIVSIVLVGSYFLLPEYGFTFSLCPLENHFLYPLSHANIWHLLGNLFCLWMLTCPMHILYTYLGAVACSFLPCLISEPTMGFSGVLFVMVGMSWGKVHKFKDMLWSNKWILIIPAFLPHINFLIHFYCIIAGYLLGRYGTRDKRFNKREQKT